MPGFAVYVTPGQPATGPADPTNAIVQTIVDTIKRDSFTEGYKATDAEAFGLLMSRYFTWDARILEAAAFALEDANFHTECGQVREMHEAIMHADDDQPYDESMRRALFAKLTEAYGKLDQAERLSRVSILVGRAVHTMSLRTAKPVTVAEFRRAMELLDTLTK